MNIHSRGYVQEQFGQLSGGFTKDFAVVETILRDRHRFFDEIRDGIGVQDKTRAMVVSTLPSWLSMEQSWAPLTA